MKKFSFEPIANENSKVLILGTMPGDESLRTGQYYANPSNQFWKLVSDNYLLAKPYELKIKYLLDHGIAIWDTLSEAKREGSSDGQISEDKQNDIKTFLSRFPNIKRILFNGTSAKKYFKRYFPEYLTSYECITLSSSSSAPGRNVKSYSEKQIEWNSVLNS